MSSKYYRPACLNSDFNEGRSRQDSQPLTINCQGNEDRQLRNNNKIYLIIIAENVVNMIRIAV